MVTMTKWEIKDCPGGRPFYYAMTDSEYIKHCVDTNPIDFYRWSKWERLRKTVLAMDRGECQLCKAHGKYTKATVVHHVNHLDKRPDLGLSIWYEDTQGTRRRNLVSLCHACHDKIHGRMQFDDHAKKQNENSFMNDERWD